MVDIGTQFDNLLAKAQPNIDEEIMMQMDAFGENMINNIIPLQKQFKNLTGNTISSFAFGTYLNGDEYNIGLHAGKAAIRWKLTGGESVPDRPQSEAIRALGDESEWRFIDYDGDSRKWFYADIDTDLGYGQDTSIEFIENYVPTGKYAIVFTTGTEYSEFLETKLGLNVLSDARVTAMTTFIQSFKPIK